MRFSKPNKKVWAIMLMFVRCNCFIIVHYFLSDAIMKRSSTCTCIPINSPTARLTSLTSAWCGRAWRQESHLKLDNYDIKTSTK